MRNGFCEHPAGCYAVYVVIDGKRQYYRRNHGSMLTPQTWVDDIGKSACLDREEVDSLLSLLDAMSV